jgi:hypothetical protein
MMAPYLKNGGQAPASGEQQQQMMWA